MDDPAIGKEVDGYRILGVLGRGGMGVVYKAEDVALSRTVAIKRIDPSLANDETFLRRFRSEARALARIDSPNIVSVHALRKTDLGLLIVMEYVEGGTLKDRMDAGPMDVAEALPVIQQMLTALKHAHGAGVIHRDIKPHNIMLTEEGRVKVTDFGLAKVHRPDTEGTVTQGVYGTLNYMSPEQVRGLGQVDHRSDIYSLGMTIYEMIAGCLPFDVDAGEFAIMRAIVEEELSPPDRFASSLPAPLVQAVMKALAKEPEDRFQRAAEMQRAFEGVAEARADRVTSAGAETEASHVDSPPTATPFRRVGLVGVLVLLLSAGGYVTYSQLAGESPEPRPETSALTVSTEPSGADVYVNGRAVGQTPLAEMAVAGDSLALRLEMEGYRTVDTTLYLADRTTSMLDVQLTTMSPESSDEDDGPGSNPETDDDGTTTNDASDDDTTPTARGTLDLSADPDGTVLIDDRVWGTGPVAVPVGRHRIRFEHPQYGVKDTTVTVAAGRTLQLTCYFEQTISVNHQGAWGNVWINGENTGQSTPHTFTRGPGTYRVELRIQRAGYTIPDGEYFRSVDGRRTTSSFSGNVKTLSIEPTFTPTKHALLFRATRSAP